MDIKSILVLTVSISVLTVSDRLTETPKDNISKEKMLELVNRVRKGGFNCGGKQMPPVDPIEWNDKLATAAYNHSKDMNRKDYFSHTSKNGDSAGDRIKKAGYNWNTYGENIAWGQQSEEDVMRSWLKSPGHCKNIMKKGVKHMGVAKSGSYWTQVFAAGE